MSEVSALFTLRRIANNVVLVLQLTFAITSYAIRVFRFLVRRRKCLLSLVLSRSGKFGQPLILPAAVTRFFDTFRLTMAAARPVCVVQTVVVQFVGLLLTTVILTGPLAATKCFPAEMPLPPVSTFKPMRMRYLRIITTNLHHKVEGEPLTD